MLGMLHTKNPIGPATVADRRARRTGRPKPNRERSSHFGALAKIVTREGGVIDVLVSTGSRVSDTRAVSGPARGSSGLCGALVLVYFWFTSGSPPWPKAFRQTARARRDARVPPTRWHQMSSRSEASDTSPPINQILGSAAARAIAAMH